MDIKEILSKTDHTLLTPSATWEEIRQICDDGIKFHTASVCIPPSYVKRAKEYVEDRGRICTVIGFPNGYSTSSVKAYETSAALNDGADEIDMVINIGDLKDKRYDRIKTEIYTLKNICKDKILKVIIEACMLDESGADFIKTSTGFGSGGAVFDDIVLFKENVGRNVKIKAAGGIGSIADAEKFIELGADRLGTSRIVKLVKKEEGIYDN